MHGRRGEFAPTMHNSSCDMGNKEECAKRTKFGRGVDG
jgi:hypothetical protein